MHSSISSSEPIDRSLPVAKANFRPRHAIIAILASVACVMLSAELLSRFAFPRISQIESRITRDEHQIMAIASADRNSPPTVLLVGNSLLLRGLEYPRIRTELAPDAQVFRLVIENTEYLDWHYGLRHMFESGVR